MICFIHHIQSLALSVYRQFHIAVMFYLVKTVKLKFKVNIKQHKNDKKNNHRTSLCRKQKHLKNREKNFHFCLWIFPPPTTIRWNEFLRCSTFHKDTVHFTVQSDNLGKLSSLSLSCFITSLLSAIKHLTFHL